MQAYDDAVNDACMPTCQLEGLDTFGAARAAFESLVATLAGAQAAGWPHDQVEEHLDIDGRELLRLLYQGHLDLRALHEQHAVAQGRIAPVVDADGIVHHKVEQGHVAT